MSNFALIHDFSPGEKNWTELVLVEHRLTAQPTHAMCGQTM